MQLELEAADDTKIAAAAADRPEKIGVVLGAGAQLAPVCGDHIGGKQVVHRHSVLS